MRRGLCRACGGTITFLPRGLVARRLYALPIIRSALREHARRVPYPGLRLEIADPDRFPERSTIDRWARAFRRPRPPSARGES